MNRKRIFALAFAVLMVLALAACGTKNNDKMGDMSGNGSAMTGEPKNAEEALALHKELLEQENAILSENTELWEKVFTEADKGTCFSVSPKAVLPEKFFQIFHRFLLRDIAAEHAIDLAQKLQRTELVIKLHLNALCACLYGSHSLCRLPVEQSRVRHRHDLSPFGQRFKGNELGEVGKSHSRDLPDYFVL